MKKEKLGIRTRWFILKRSFLNLKPILLIRYTIWGLEDFSNSICKSEQEIQEERRRKQQNQDAIIKIGELAAVLTVKTENKAEIERAKSRVYWDPILSKNQELLERLPDISNSEEDIVYLANIALKIGE